MDLTTYERLIKTEKAARNYLLGFCFENHQRFCPRCKGRKLYRLEDGRRRCASGRYTFQDFSGRWINRRNLTAGQWLRLIKLFELELSVRKIAQQLRLSYNAAYKTVHTIRSAILAHSADGKMFLGGEVEGEESYFGGKRKGKRGRGAAGKVPVFGILEREGRVFVEVVPTTRAKDVLALTVKKVRRGSIVYTDRYKVYDTLMFCGYRHLRVPDLVDRTVQKRHRVVPIERYRRVGILLRRPHLVRFPHVRVEVGDLHQGDSFVSQEQPEFPEGSGTGVFRHEDYPRLRQVAEGHDVLMTFLLRALVHADLGKVGVVGRIHRLLHLMEQDPPQAVEVDLHDLDRHRHLSAHQKGQRLEQERKLAARPRPRDAQLAHTVDGTGNPRHPRGEKRLVLEEIEMRLRPLVRVVDRSRIFPLTLGAEKLRAPLEIKEQVQAALPEVELGFVNEPVRRQSERQSEELLLVHPSPPRPVVTESLHR